MNVVGVKKYYVHKKRNEKNVIIVYGADWFHDP